MDKVISNVFQKARKKVESKVIRTNKSKDITKLRARLMYWKEIVK